MAIGRQPWPPPGQFSVQLGHDPLDDGCEQPLLAVVTVIERAARDVALTAPEALALAVEALGQGVDS